MGDNGIQRGGFGMPKQGRQPPASLKVKRPKEKPKPVKKAPEPKLSRATRDRIEARNRRISRYEAKHGGSCAVTAIVAGVSLVGAVMTMKGLA